MGELSASWKFVSSAFATSLLAPCARTQKKLRPRTAAVCPAAAALPACSGLRAERPKERARAARGAALPARGAERAWRGDARQAHAAAQPALSTDRHKFEIELYLFCFISITQCCGEAIEEVVGHLGHNIRNVAVPPAGAIVAAGWNARLNGATLLPIQVAQWGLVWRVGRRIALAAAGGPAAREAYINVDPFGPPPPPASVAPPAAPAAAAAKGRIVKMAEVLDQGDASETPLADDAMHTKWCHNYNALTGGEQPVPEDQPSLEQLTALALDLDKSGAVDWVEWIALALFGSAEAEQAAEPMSIAFRLLDRPVPAREVVDCGPDAPETVRDMLREWRPPARPPPEQHGGDALAEKQQDNSEFGLSHLRHVLASLEAYKML
ncbi:unnamed protein product [Prorocentrum cordatum]|uniref:EF-hand domain-containing protein n=1 Tax=Prorocentrum cordatum TaxID=2364126 RepID=A0ABN9X087_9DINO|nr:unnamed protein product [Polarella glacialis]